MRNLLILSIFLLQSVLGYTQNTTSFSGLIESKGPIPAVFLTNKEAKYPRELTDRSFESNNELIERELFQSGKVLFGDDITNYIASVGNSLIANDKELSGKLSFYTFNSTEIKSFSTASGIIFISTGLISQLVSEDQLAFAIAHEIGHYTLKHKNLSYIGFEDVFIRGLGVFEVSKKFDKYFYRTEEEKMFADNYAVSLLAKNNYNKDKITTYFDILKFGYLPFDEEKFDTTFFNIDSNFVLPVLPRNELTEIMPENNGEFDRFRVMENIDERKSKVKEWIRDMSFSEEKVLSKTEFLAVQKLARFEIVHLNLMNRQYYNAIYHSYLLLKKYPNDDFLLRAVPKGLYGIAVYSINHHSKEIKLKSAQGESSYLPNLFEKLNAEQIGVTAMLSIKKYLDKNPEDEFMISLQESLIRNLKKISKIDSYTFKNKFYVEPKIAANIDSTSLSKYDRIKLKKQTYVYEKANNENFHFLISEIINSDILIMDLLKNQVTERDSVILEKGTLSSLMNPNLRSENSKYGLDLLKVDYEIEKLYNSFKNYDSAGKLALEFYCYRDLLPSETEKFNYLSNTKNWYSECIQHLSMSDFITLESDNYLNIIINNNQRYVLFSLAEMNNDSHANASYTNGLYDLKSGRLIQSSTNTKNSYDFPTYIRLLRDTMNLLD